MALVRPVLPVLTRWARGLHWYLREMTGDADYDRYLARHQAVHPGQPPLSRGEFQARRWSAQESRPASRCC